jgi:hypothetical protein
MRPGPAAPQGEQLRTAIALQKLRPSVKYTMFLADGVCAAPLTIASTVARTTFQTNAKGARFARTVLADSDPSRPVRSLRVFRGAGAGGALIACANAPTAMVTDPETV